MLEPARHVRYWAKTTPSGSYHPVLYHCLDVASAGFALLSARPRALERLVAASRLSAEFLLSFIPLLLSFHDLGKLADGFQSIVSSLMERLQGELRQATYNKDLFRHDSVGYAVLEERLHRGCLSSMVAPELRDAFARTWLSAAMGHHGRPPIFDLTRASELKRQFPAEVAQDLDATLAELRELFLPNGLVLPSELDEFDFEEYSQTASWLFAGLAVLADWLGSNAQFFPPTDAEHTARDYFEKIALPAAKRAVQDAGLREQPLSAAKSFADLWPGYVPTPLQELAASLPLANGPQLIVIEEVTGGGKTEAAFTLAHRLVAAGEAEGLYFGLPTMATANAMYDRLGSAWLHLFGDDAQPSLVLAHGKRDLRLDQLAEEKRQAKGERESAGELCAAWLADSRKKALLAEVGVGTIDQALLGVLQARHQSLRIWGLAGKVLVVDEVHACDAYMQNLLAGLLEAHAAFGGSAILLSATLPSGQQRKLLAGFAQGARLTAPSASNAAYPALHHFSANGAATHALSARPEASRTLGVQLVNDEVAVDALLTDTLAAGGCACWIRNTVGDAMAAFERWREQVGDDRVELFHARFTVADRHLIEQDVLRRFGKESGPGERAGRLLIATQVVEQSLDLDFDTLVSDLAPIDLLVQRAGRLRRHQRSARGERVAGPDERGEAVLHVFSPSPVPDAGATWFSESLPGAARVYEDHGRLWAGARWLEQHGRLRVPEDLREVIEAVYAPVDDLEVPEALAEISRKAEGKARAAGATAGLNRIGFRLGYEPSGMVSSWRDDVLTPTRLGDPTVTLRLGRLEGEQVVPLHEGHHGWQLSEVQVRQSLVAAEWPGDAALIEKAKAGMRDLGKWSLLIVLRSGPSGLRADAQRPGGKPVQISYSSDFGLEVERP